MTRTRPGIPTTYYGAVQLIGTATVQDERMARAGWRPSCAASWLRSNPTSRWPTRPRRTREAAAILGIQIAIEEVQAKFKYGGNVDEAHRLAVVDRLGDGAVRAMPPRLTTLRRLES